MSRSVSIAVFVCLAVSFIPSVLHAVAISEAWTEVYPYSDSDKAEGVAFTDDGGCIAVGHSWSGGQYDVSAIRVDKNGNEVWRRTYGGASSDAAYSVKQVSDGGFIVAGYTDSYGAGHLDYYLVRLDANGDTLWTRTYGGVFNDAAFYVEVTPDEGYAIVGETYSYGAGATDAYLVRTDSDGDTLWTRTYGTTDYEWCYCVRNTNDGNLVITGATGPYGTQQAFLTKINSANGNVIWSKQHGGAGDEYGVFVEPLWSGEYMLTGYTTSFGDPDGDALVVRAYSNGDSVWMRAFGGDDFDYGHGIKQMDDSLFIVVIEMMDMGGSWTDAYVFTMDLDGVELTGATYGAMGDEWFNDIDGSFQYGYVMAGISNSYSASDDFWVLKTLGTSPTIESVSDVTNDQGRQARVRWYRSWYDEPDAGVSITEYSVWRKYDAALAAGGPGVAEGDFPRLGYPPGEWDYIMSVPARGEDFYSVVVPTLCDSTDGGMCRSHFFVSAETSDPLTFFDSRPDSGYSIDNLAPGPPAGLHMVSATEIVWEEAPEEDFDYFAVYGSDDGDFDIAIFIGYTIDIYMDVGGDVFGFYHVTATDFAGNEGEPATTPNHFADVGGRPMSFALRQNSPNPFTVSTSICFDIPKRSHVMVDVIDVSGRVVRTLVEETRSADRHYVTWDGRDDVGTDMGPGIYFLRMKAGEFEATRKMMLLR
jgi:hypothetical protein